MLVVTVVICTSGLLPAIGDLCVKRTAHNCGVAGSSPALATVGNMLGQDECFGCLRGCCLNFRRHTARIELSRTRGAHFSAVSMPGGVRIGLAASYESVTDGPRMRIPPSTGMHTPVMKEASSDARKAITAATSLASPKRPRAC